MPPDARQNSHQLCLASSLPFPSYLIIFLPLVLTFSSVFSLVLFLFLLLFFSVMNTCQCFFPHSLGLTFFFSSPSITSLSSTLPPNKKLSLLHVPTRHLLTQRPRSAGTSEGHTQTGTSRDSKQFGRSKCLLPSVLGNEELGKSFRDDRKKNKGPKEKARVAHTLCVIPLSPNATALVAR